MSTPFSPRLVKGGLVQVDPNSGKVLRVITVQYNPDTLTRTLQVQASGESGDRSMALRLKGAAIETIKLEIEIDATENLDDPAAHADAVKLGIQPQLATLEALVYPSADALQQNDGLASSGVLEILPLEEPLTLFVWSKQRILPVRVTDLSVTEEAFDALLNPDSGEGVDWPARALGGRPRIRPPRRLTVHGPPAQQGKPGRSRGSAPLSQLGVESL